MDRKTLFFISGQMQCREEKVFDGGSIVQDGGHEQLLADEAGKYAQLWNAQAQYYTKA